MVDASNVFQTFAVFFSKLGFFIFLPLSVAVFIFANARRFESENTKRRLMNFVKLALLIFGGLQLPSILVRLISG
ncbi:hypothetical protein A2716_00580 [candidate division WWE3 bacterium RIFCSPHIGHO2_01_FULL_40_23]|uniref:Uncharacterized protein n=1 Tax=candidate division WWE3 bacterium RIFCSPLOWO2_01_FULL_41_18 TaxID=1802625 RepID=A0A1F4VEX8_UNCKA|nr:MAG: hypothetical protein A2716_00580 [candidate division WWE3 bacterium RIFCSPHIGHO2_01_FULL_40_23]OGC55490.1 MAG: hypothetical protein A3A78_00850 [candidate division WWE3 bacterium RIFCSPLOWO2_01_FULL_41_18]